jgi:hypothetical protein
MVEINKAEETDKISCPRLPRLFFSAMIELDAASNKPDNMNWTRVTREDPHSAAYFAGLDDITPPASK